MSYAGCFIGALSCFGFFRLLLRHSRQLNILLWLGGGAGLLHQANDTFFFFHFEHLGCVLISLASLSNILPDIIFIFILSDFVHMF